MMQPEQDVEKQVISAMLIDAVQREAVARVALVQALAEIAALKAQAAAPQPEPPK
jgi:hypothetical protein